MTRWLWIEGSPRGQASRSSGLARSFLDALRPTSVERLNVWEADLPAFGQPAVEARYAVIEGRAEAAQAAEWDAVRRLFSHVHGHDAFVVSAPMWNWGLPWRLKQLIDVLTQPGLAFTVGADGSVAGAFGTKRVAVFTSSALSYQGGLAALDHGPKHLADWLDFIGLTDRAHVHAAPMYGDPSVVLAAYASALTAAAGLAARFE